SRTHLEREIGTRLVPPEDSMRRARERGEDGVLPVGDGPPMKLDGENVSNPVHFGTWAGRVESDDDSEPALIVGERAGKESEQHESGCEDGRKSAHGPSALAGGGEFEI